MLIIRPQNSTDDPAEIAGINAAAFAEHGETKAFDDFRTKRDDILSLVAEDNSRLAGHVLFSPVHLDSPAGLVTGMGLGQLAVLPEKQRTGIGTRLSEAGLTQLRKDGCPFVIVIGHASYYPRFGFESASKHNIRCQWDGIPEETFMALILDPKHPTPLSGTARFDGL